MKQNLVLLLLAAGLLLRTVPATATAPIPITGTSTPELAVFDTAMTNFMRAYNVKGGALAVMHNGRLVLKQGYGWSDKNLTVPFHPDSRVRVASNSKTFTAAAIKHLIEREVIATNTPAISFAGIEPYGGRWGDARWRDIHVLQFLAHRSGWDNDIPEWFSMSSVLSLDHAATMNDMISYLLTRPLKSQPGSRFDYSSPSYSVLALVIEKASAVDFFTYVTRNVVRPWGIRGIGLQRTEPKLREFDEPYYDNGGAALGRNNANFPTEELLPIPDGGADYLHESSIGPGGLLASVEALVTLAQTRLISHGNSFSPAAGISSFMNGDPRRWRHLEKTGAQAGGEAGAYSFNFQNTNGVDFACFFNLSLDAPLSSIVSQLKRLTEITTTWPGDNSTRITLAAESFAVGEEESELVIGVRRIGESAGNVSATFTVSPGTARAGIDFTPGTGTVRFADDEITALITVPILNNRTVDGARDFTVVLTEPTGGAQLGTARALVTIEDDDAPQFPPTIQITSPTNNATAAGTLGIAVGLTPGTRPVAKVEFFAGSTLIGEENKPPYTLAWKPRFRSGRMLLTARATDDRGLASTSPPVLVNLGTNLPPGTASGLLREFWTRRPGTGLTNLTTYSHFPRRPTGWELLENFEAPPGWGEYHGARLRGYLTPPLTGEYRFRITADDRAELWLSNDDKADNKQLIASVNASTGPLDWDTAPKSQPVLLEAGRRYYVEALHKQRVGSEHLAVGWQQPDGSLELPISGKRLAPFSMEPQPVLVKTGFRPSGFTFTLNTCNQHDQVIEASSDLLNWLPLLTNTATGLMMEFQDADAANFPRRFYRALLHTAPRNATSLPPP